MSLTSDGHYEITRLDSHDAKPDAFYAIASMGYTNPCKWIRTAPNQMHLMRIDYAKSRGWIRIVTISGHARGFVRSRPSHAGGLAPVSDLACGIV